MDSLQKLYQNAKAGFADIREITQNDNSIIIIPISKDISNYDLYFEPLIEVGTEIKEYSVLAESNDNTTVSTEHQLIYENGVPTIKICWNERFKGYIGVTIKS